MTCPLDKICLVHCIHSEIYSSLNYATTGIVTYSVGSGGGLRVQAPLKVMVTDMGMFTVPASVKVDFVNKKFDEQGTFVFLFCVINYTKFN